ncbi:D-alanyl-D-alanine carboxypeptidase/D-alanyl-D-alanine endopeptidase [Epilithonimonas mollis]|uniref:D-alanyl-D-alanine carboxypeptidase / D-alanyl-D-alanine-endopeptidase (Penicillin-binding protein 4) n=1 Tax=Epilithonimonas mollis TaxID=216903 RepID=A0A1M6TAM7_9FLAO|nr:D-alanyl-D-alanine carboxypeptidase/D-alanyl-D-alanine-endopeptidase [Epilithonimonas mollis]SHK53919.1 D-alanyl-D-alanine carboxypeptidase / D-alanyl-D-alanine-endopeptidase (penicillin-binding protein 4) [Epilithonimonas mollis]
MNKLRNYFSIITIGISSVIFSQGSVAVSSFPQVSENQGLVKDITAEKALLSPKDQIEFNINKMFTDPVLRNANWGFVVYDPKTEKIVTAYNETAPLIPASTTKLLTTETAFSLLGTQYRWNTQLEYSGSIDADGILTGNLYIVGSGDPSLGGNRGGAASYTQIVSQYLDAIREKGIKKITGDIIIQTAIFKENKTELPQNIVWLEQKNYFLPVGTTKDIDPRNEKLIINQSNNPFNQQKKYFYVSPYANKLVYADKFEGSWVTTKVAEPPAFLANKLRESLVKNKITVSGKVAPKIVDREPEPREVLTVYKSPTLTEIINYTNQRSDNNYAEALLKANGFHKLGDQTIESGRTVVKDHLQSIGFDLNGLNYMDGSGLSKAHTVTPISQVKFLAKMMKSPYYKEYFESLPIAGQSGTLKHMFLLNSNGQIFAKTGTLNGVKCLAGYIKTRNNRTLAFSLLINKFSGSVSQVKDRMEQLLDPTLDL